MTRANLFNEQLQLHNVPLNRAAPEILQLNIGRMCNLECTHCHVTSGPTRTEHMSLEVAALCVKLLDNVPSIHTVDLTGGAPEMAPAFRYLVREARARNKRVIDRCNLTILNETGYEDLAVFLQKHQVDVVASLPCYTEGNVDKQRGDGVFTSSIKALQTLNALGYGKAEGKNPTATHRLDLVYNPGGASLPGSQAGLERDYRNRLMQDFGIRFDHLITITNMAIGRFATDLRLKGKLDSYNALLVSAFNPSTVQHVMCRTTISVDHDGRLYDCDFNQILRLPIAGEHRFIQDFAAQEWEQLPITTGTHCLGCTAGAGSSCSGALLEA